MPLITSPKRRGEWVELQFMARAASHGFTVSKPWGDSARYDFIVEHKSLFRRVQVKSTTALGRGKNANKGAYMCNTISRNPLGQEYGYTADQIDFFAFYIIPEDIWYIVPLSQMKRTRYAAYLNPYQRSNRYFRYMEAWNLLRH